MLVRPAQGRHLSFRQVTASEGQDALARHVQARTAEGADAGGLELTACIGLVDGQDLDALGGAGMDASDRTVDHARAGTLDRDLADDAHGGACRTGSPGRRRSDSHKRTSAEEGQWRGMDGA
jgi:hypothetical protein